MKPYMGWLTSLALLLGFSLGWADTVPAQYQLGPEDQLAIRVLEVEEYNNLSLRVGLDGMVDLPLVGRMKAGGTTAEQFQTELTKRLRKYIQEPQVSVNVTEYSSRSVSVIGSVNTPGVHLLKGPRRLVEVLSMAGGLRPDAGSLVQVTRQAHLPALGLPNEHKDATGQFHVAEVDLNALMRAENPSHNVTILPQDVVSVPRAEVVYVLGEVHKAGGFTVQRSESLSLLQAVALAEGLQRTAAPKKARILRAAYSGGTRQEILVNLQKVMDGTAEDLSLRPGDVLFVPNNVSRSALIRTAETALQLGTGIVIFRR